MFDLKKIDDAFYYLDHESNKYVTIFGSEHADVFLNAVADLVD